MRLSCILQPALCVQPPLVDLTDLQTTKGHITIDSSLLSNFFLQSGLLLYHHQRLDMRLLQFLP